MLCDNALPHNGVSSKSSSLINIESVLAILALSVSVLPIGNVAAYWTPFYDCLCYPKRCPEMKVLNSNT